MNRRNPFLLGLLSTLFVLVVFLAYVPALGNESEASVAESAPVELLVYPSAVDLSTSRDSQSIVCQLLFDNGVTRDVTYEVDWKIANAEIVRRGSNRLLPLSDGETNVAVTWDKFSVNVPVKVSGALTRPKLSFKNDVMPVFSKSGCNAGSCHGAARGKDGFRLSLYGFDPDGDHYRLTREMLGRRINLATPEDCMLIAKSTESVPHTGGRLIQPSSASYQTLLEWLRDGAENDSGDVPKVTSIELYPKSGLLDGPDETQQLTVIAKYSDGTDRDVTSLSYFSTNNDNAADVSQSGVVTAKNRGESFVMARYDTHTVGVDFITLPKSLSFTWGDIDEHNYIDKHVHEKLRKLRIQPSEICSDAEFIRRVYLDVCGDVPTASDVTAFVSSKNENKRTQLIDQLLERKEFVDLWVMKWSELLQIRSTKQVSYKSTLLYYTWLQQQIGNNVPVDQMIRDILGSEGGTFTDPATNYYQNEQDNLKVAENVAQVFMGMRIQCAQCHNHPFDRWTMDDYYSFAAFFAQVGRKRAEDPREQIVYNRRNGEIKHPVTGAKMAPKFLGGETPKVKNRDRRVVLAAWLTSPDNPYFSKNLANIVWAHFFGQGIVNEVDDVRVSNPPVNPALLDELGQRFADAKFDFKTIIRDICNSRTYQLSTQTNETNESDLTNFSHAKLRRIRAEVLLDVISQITETKDKFRGLPLGARAVQIADGNTSNYFLSTFGRAKRETVCSCEVISEPNLSQALHLLNGKSSHNKIKKGKLIARLLEQGKSPKEIVNELYLRCLARTPTENELDQILAEVNNADDKNTALQDVFWALLNSREFVFNH